MLLLAVVLVILVALCVTYYVKYDEEKQTEGLTAWSIKSAKEFFKGGKINEREGIIVKVGWKLKEGDDDIITFSKNDMEKMQADPGDLVYITDARKWLGGLKSIHSVYGVPHDEDGIVYITDEHMMQRQFVKNKTVIAEKEM
jgi:SSS family solute:Na+ symporter